MPGRARTVLESEGQKLHYLKFPDPQPQVQLLPQFATISWPGARAAFYSWSSCRSALEWLLLLVFGLNLICQLFYIQASKDHPNPTAMGLCTSVSESSFSGNRLIAVCRKNAFSMQDKYAHVSKNRARVFPMF